MHPTQLTTAPINHPPPFVLADEREIFYPETDFKPMAETDLHRDTLASLVQLLKRFYRDTNDIYVSGNLLIYYEEGNPFRSVAPDVFVVKNVSKRNRRIYKLWEEKQAPSVVIELSSKSTAREDLQKKWRLYERLGVAEYFIFDPEYAYLDLPLIGYRLEDGEYVELELSDNRIFSQELNLELVAAPSGLRLFDRERNDFLPTPDEAEERLAAADAEIAELRRQLQESNRHQS